MSQNRRQGNEDRQISRGRGAHALQCQRHAERWQEALEHVQSEDQKEVAETEVSTHVGGADVAGANGPDVDSADQVVNQVAEGNRPDQVAGKASQQVLNPGIHGPAHWSRPILTIALSAPPRNAARRASKISLAVA